jgi:predicted RNA-binding protein YlxR (DUF448 family)
MFDKPQLIRIVKKPDDSVVIDHVGKVSGRGAYVCKNADCVEKAIKRKSIDRALGIQTGEEIHNMIREEIA